MKIYIINHKYLKTQEVFLTKKQFIEFCDKMKLDSKSLINGKEIQGWILDII